MTPSQTVGPFFSFALSYDGDWELVQADHPEAILIEGRVLDGAAEPVPDAMLELWAGPGGSGFGRCATAPDGSYRFRTGRPDGPYLALLVFARGLLRPVATRIYLDDGPDPLLDTLDPARRRTMIARHDGAVHRFDVRLQGHEETVFLEY